MTSQEVVDFVRQRLVKPEFQDNLSRICEELFDYCLAPNTYGDGTGCDNMTCIIVNFKENLNNKRNSSTLDTSIEGQPEKRPKLDVDETTQGFTPSELGGFETDK
ncbi:probable protein phosphatase CG10417 [Saccostrea cucullata]|uniref:probable protein phosphatase CG10417 n=1 Tax=Saccostrea cuccullata TaxID=36930 RepID=UPI002ED3CF2D